MGAIQISRFRGGKSAASFACACLLVTVFAAFSALAQSSEKPASTANNQDILAKIGRWFDEQFATFNANVRNAQTKLDANVKDAKSQIDNFGREASIAAKTGADAAKDAADQLARLPNSRVIKTHERCIVAPNGAPDCTAAVLAACKAKGFNNGKSLDMTTAEKCPAKVWISGRAPEPGECTTETFVSRVLCN
jgi:hypothetical protein